MVKRGNIIKMISWKDAEGFEFHLEPIEESLKIEKIKDGYVAKYLTHDEMAESPDEDGDDAVFLVNYHSDFDVRRDNIITEDDVREFYMTGKSELEKEYYIISLACLVHSGVWLGLNYSFPCDPGGWDTSHVGVVCVSRKEADTMLRATELAEGLLETWNQYLQGDVYCIVKETYDKDKEPIDYDMVGGYFGHEYALKELESFEGFR